MGRNTSACPVPFKSSIPESLASAMYEWIEDSAEDEDSEGLSLKDFSGWKLDCNLVEYVKGKNSVWCESLVNGDYRVYIINEHEYDGEDWAVFSESKADLQKFLADFKHVAPIDEDTVVQQTI